MIKNTDCNIYSFGFCVIVRKNINILRASSSSRRAQIEVLVFPWTIVLYHISPLMHFISSFSSSTFTFSFSSSTTPSTYSYIPSKSSFNPPACFLMIVLNRWFPFLRRTFI